MTEILGFYARDNKNNLFKYQWTVDNRLELLIDGEVVVVDSADYEIVQVGIITNK